ncbi:GNAT family N-acetyltransferase [Rouxiella silvae]|uniref:GNAT family N-acetyltransferase n=1 Tax=Rouxiella silvae TaxID=1646373 RepID=A0AA41BVI7_9GAMM|nr:GNAT family N-acetyltransferase [Rouxiella silvae]KQN51307.1 hypothetical protein ASE93_20985 [Serratia sp. Leaf50]MBF6635952.1 GNAT family N-acetyltransferase [Rouxiella silvae]
MIQLLTPRLTLTRLCESDWPFFLQMRKNPQLMKYIADIGSDEDDRTRFESRLHDWQPGSVHALDFIIRDRLTSMPLGNIGFKPVEGEVSEVEVGYTLIQQAQRKGYASEALKAVINFAFSNTIITSLRAAVLAGNSGSSKLLENNGFSLSEVIKDGFYINGEYHDDLIYNLRKC